MVGVPAGSGRARRPGRRGRCGPGRRPLPAPARPGPGSAGPGRRVSWRCAPTSTRTRGDPDRPLPATSQPTRRSTASRAAARQVKIDIVAPVTKPTPLVSGRPRRSSSQALATSSTAACAGLTARSTAFWSQALTSQSAARAAGCVPPITIPKNRPDGIAVRPGSQALASRSITSLAGVGPAGSSVPSALTTSAAEARGGTGRVGRLSSQRFAWRAAWSSAMYRSVMPPVSAAPACLARAPPSLPAGLPVRHGAEASRSRCRVPGGRGGGRAGPRGRRG